MAARSTSAGAERGATAVIRVCRATPAEEQRPEFVATQVPPEVGIAEARPPAHRHLQIAGQDPDAPDHVGRLRHAIQRHREHVVPRRPHEPLPPAPAPAPLPDVALARAHRPQVHDAQLGRVYRARDPALHATEVAVDPVPADLPNEASDLAEAGDPVELRGTDGVLVAHALEPQPSIRSAQVDLSREVAEPGLGIEARENLLEVPLRQLELEFELAYEVVVAEIHAREARVEGIDHAGPDASLATILPLHEL